jgi:hypothetical protein
MSEAEKYEVLEKIGLLPPTLARLQISIADLDQDTARSESSARSGENQTAM